jgi:hypothetical protein
MECAVRGWGCNSWYAEAEEGGVERESECEGEGDVERDEVGEGGDANAAEKGLCESGGRGEVRVAWNGGCGWDWDWVCVWDGCGCDWEW